jgi:hypothetical protein
MPHAFHNKAHVNHGEHCAATLHDPRASHTPTRQHTHTQSHTHSHTHTEAHTHTATPPPVQAASCRRPARGARAHMHARAICSGRRGRAAVCDGHQVAGSRHALLAQADSCALGLRGAAWQARGTASVVGMHTRAPRTKGQARAQQGGCQCGARHQHRTLANAPQSSGPLVHAAMFRWLVECCSSAVHVTVPSKPLASWCGGARGAAAGGTQTCCLVSLRCPSSQQHKRHTTGLAAVRAHEHGTHTASTHSSLLARCHPQSATWQPWNEQWPPSCVCCVHAVWPAGQCW